MTAPLALVRTSAAPAARWTLVATSFGLGMALLDVTAVNVAIPDIESSLRTDVRGLSWVIDAYTLSFASLLLLAGGLGDRLGAKRVFTAGFVLFTAASALCGVAPGIGTLVFARMLQGLGAAMFMPSSLAILREAYPDVRERAHAIGIWSALTAIAGASGPVVGGLLVTAFGWRSIFLLNVPVGLVAIGMAIRFVVPSVPSRARGLDLAAQLTAAGALALFTWALIERPARGWTSPVILLALLASAAGIAAFIALESRSADPVLPLRLFSNRTFSATASAALLYAGAFFGTVLVYSLYFQQILGEPASTAGLHIAAVSGTFGVTSLGAGRLVGRFGTRAPILAGLSALVLSAWAAATMRGPAPFTTLAPALALMGFGAGLVAPAMNAAILASVPRTLSGIGAGVLNAARQVGTALAVAVFASFFHERAPFAAVRLALLCAGALYLGALLLSTRARETA